MPNPVTVYKAQFSCFGYIFHMQEWFNLERDFDLCFVQVYDLSFVAWLVGGCSPSFTKCRTETEEIWGPKAWKIGRTVNKVPYPIKFNEVHNKIVTI